MSQRRIVMVWLEMLAAVAAVLGGSALVRYAHGQVMNDRSEAACKANKLWLERCWQQGVIARIPCGTLYLREHAETPVTVGCGRMATNGSGGYWIPSDHPTLAGKTSRICQLTQGEEIFRLRGAGFICLDPLYFEMPGSGAAITVEGRHEGVATGRHLIRAAVFYNMDAAIKALPGYYDADRKFVEDENHGDNSTVEDCSAMNCKRFFWSQNQQAVNWYFNRIVMEWAFTKAQPVIFADIERGGKVHINGLEWCTNLATLFRVRDFSPNQCWLTCRDMSYDRMGDESYLTVLEYTGKASDANFGHFAVDCEGFVSQSLPADRVLNVPADLPRDRIKIRLQSIYGDVLYPKPRNEK